MIRKLIDRARRLRAAGVLGMNDRNREFIAKANPRKAYPLVDDKLRTKEAAIAARIAVPELYGCIAIPHDVRRLRDIIGDRKSFVVKPASGSGGEGVLVVRDVTPLGYRLMSGRVLKEEEMAHHIINILGGLFSLGGRPDKAMIEYRVEFDPVFERVSYLGVPDIRIIVFCGIPVMAMVRLPTRISDGKANLHQGAVGAGIDLATGLTIGAVWESSPVLEHPDTGHSVVGLRVPEWNKLLLLASQCATLTTLGYLGVDIVLDRTRGPLVLELNARPGLAIQIANRSGLRKRLEQVLAVGEKVKNWSVEERMCFAQRSFSHPLTHPR